MRAIRWLFVVVFVLGLGAAVSAGGSDAKLMQEVRALGDALTKAMLDNEVEVMLEMYADDAISLPNYGPRMQGKDAFRKHHRQMAEYGMKVIAFDSDPTEVWKAGKHVIEIGTFKIKLEMPGMPVPVEDKGKYMTVYVRDKGGSLKIKAETWNTDVNPMEMAGGGSHTHGDHD
jgi:ketosteroid isomerase-like protein